MKVIIKTDAHTHREHEGLELTLVRVDCPSFTGGPYFISGLAQKIKKPKGMFDEGLQPIQALELDDLSNEYSYFSMANCGCVSTRGVETVLAGKTLNLGHEKKVFTIRLATEEDLKNIKE